MQYIYVHYGSQTVVVKLLGLGATTEIRMKPRK